MQVLGIIGGVSWHSTAEYYKQLNQQISNRLGARHSARLVLSSLNFADLLEWQKDSDQSRLKDAFLAEGQRLKAAGCDAFIIASHTLSWLGDLIENELGLHHVSLYDALFERLNAAGFHCLGLLGTKYTMRDPLYRSRYERAGFSLIIPEEPDFTRIATIVYKELVNGIFRPESKGIFMGCVEELVTRGAEAVVLGCTEIGLLVTERQWAKNSKHLDSESIELVDLIETHVGQCVKLMIGK